MKEIILNQILIPSLQRLYQVDYDNIRFDVSERNICARLAHHMENIMREYDQVHKSDLFGNYFSDVEYNRMGNGDLKHYENCLKCPKYMVSDLLIQSRDFEQNYLALEMNKKGKMQNADNDRNRLKSLVSPSSPNSRSDCVHDTLLGAFIVFDKEGIQMELYSYSEIVSKVEKANYLGVYMYDKLYVTWVNKTDIQ